MDNDTLLKKEEETHAHACDISTSDQQAAFDGLHPALRAYIGSADKVFLAHDGRVQLDTASAALAYKHLAGCSVIPTSTAPGAEKRPTLKTWKRFQEEAMADEDITREWTKELCGIAVLCGEISCHLEILDVETDAAWQKIKEKVSEEKGPEFFSKFYVVVAPKGGRHVYYRCPGHVPGAQKLAMERLPDLDVKGRMVPNYGTLVETRGEGNYALAVGSSGIAHPTGKRYVIEQLTPEQIPVISPEDREYLLANARSLDERPAPTTAPTGSPRSSGSARLTHLASSPVGGRPGDDFNERAAWEDILPPGGWQVHHIEAEVTFWTRPGKAVHEGHSATTGYCGDFLHVFSSSAHPFDPGATYSKFSAYSMIEHGGDFSAAAKRLASEGYGTQAKEMEWRDVPDGHSVGDDIDGEETLAHASSVGPAQSDKIRSKQYQVAVLCSTAENECDLFVDQYGNTAATVKATWQTCAVDSRSFKAWLYAEYKRKYNVRVQPEAMSNAITNLILEAQNGGTQHVYSRYATVGEGAAKKIFVNMGCGYIEISSSGVRRVLRPPVKMVLPNTAHSLPEPDLAASKEVLTDLGKIINYATDDDRILHTGYLVGCIDSLGGFPILEMVGPQGSAKTQAARVTRAILDPDTVSDRGIFKDEDSLRASAKKNSVLVIDNVSRLSKGQSDMLCRLATGSGFEARAKYTNDDASSLFICRPVIVTRISEITKEHDYIDRAIKISLRKIYDDDYKDYDEELKPEFIAMLPKILGALYKAVSASLAGTLMPAKKIRMLAYAKRVARAETELPWAKGQHETLLHLDREAAVRASVVSDSVGIALIRLLMDCEKNHFTGVWQKLLENLQAYNPVPQKSGK